MQLKAMTPTLRGDQICSSWSSQGELVRCRVLRNHWVYTHERKYWSALIKARLALNYEWHLARVIFTITWQRLSCNNVRHEYKQTECVWDHNKRWAGTKTGQLGFELVSVQSQFSPTIGFAFCSAFWILDWVLDWSIQPTGALRAPRLNHLHPCAKCNFP